ncbi:hypothetical protein AJ88_43665 [Mesorhizobium amorphae CCBAU 01583]|nr:hypothetical protein AJ88_43665 [Mesorhizobium amorphae CCBAU 01583]
MQPHGVAVELPLDDRQQRRECPAAGEVMQLARLALPLQGACHCQDRGDPDASRQQHGWPFALSKRKMIARSRNREHASGRHRLVDPRRAAATNLFALHRDCVAAQICRIAAERILAHFPIRQMNIDVRARFEGRKQRFARVLQVDDQDVA